MSWRDKRCVNCLVPLSWSRKESGNDWCLTCVQGNSRKGGTVRRKKQVLLVKPPFDVDKRTEELGYSYVDGSAIWCHHCQFPKPPVDFYSHYQLASQEFVPMTICKGCCYYTPPWKQIRNISESWDGESHRPATHRGYVYIVRVNEFYKIGQSTSPSGRISNHQCSCPYLITDIYVGRVSDMNQVERECHRRFKSVRVTGEWFKLSKKDLADCVYLIENFKKVLAKESEQEAKRKAELLQGFMDSAQKAWEKDPVAFKENLQKYFASRY